jgi:FixJ family two-component response regulator
MSAGSAPRIAGAVDSPPPTVFIIDDDSASASQLCGLFADQGWRVLAFHTGKDFLLAPRPSGPACLVIEAALPDGPGAAVQRQLTGAGINLPIVFIARSADLRAAVEVMRRGARDFLLKPLHERELLDSVANALQDDGKSKAKRAELLELLRRESKLTARERAVLAQIVNGRLNKQVAAELALAEGTVKVYRRRLMKKMGAVSLADLVRIADRISAATVRDR